MSFELIIISLLIVSSSTQASVLRCNLIDPQSPESELCWKQMLIRMKLYPESFQDVKPENSVQTRNAEISSALMQLYGFDKYNGKRNPEFSRDVMKYISDAGPYKDNY